MGEKIRAISPNSLTSQHLQADFEIRQLKQMHTLLQRTSRVVVNSQNKCTLAERRERERGENALTAGGDPREST